MQSRHRPLPTSTLLAFLIFLAPAAHALGEWTHARAADAALIQYALKYRVPGVSIAVSQNGRILYARGYRWAGVPVPEKNGDRLVYRLASCSKPITAALALELARQGKLDLDAPARQYVPSLPTFHTYTVGDLLAHLSGVRHYRDGEDPTKRVTRHYETALSALSLFWLDPPVNKPRERYSYSTHGYTVLAAAIERVTGQPFARYAARRFAAWGLASLRPELPVPMPFRAAIYDKDNARTDRDDLSWKYAGGGFESNVRDLCKLSDMLVRNRILDRQRTDLMWTAKKLSSGAESSYGYGWSVGSENGRRRVSHNGEQNGANSHWRIYPDDGIAIVVLTNRMDTAPDRLGAYLAALAFSTGTPPAPNF